MLQNTDDEPMVLIDALVTVDKDVVGQLMARSDFGEEDNGVDGQLVWWGELVDDRSDGPVTLHSHGNGSVHVTASDEEEEHVVLGRLTPEPGRVRVQVNSERRLKRLLRILKETGAAPNVTEESRAEPSLDFAWVRCLVTD